MILKKRTLVSKPKKRKEKKKERRICTRPLSFNFLKTIGSINSELIVR